MLLFCCAAYAADGAELGERGPTRGTVCHFCHLLPCLCRQQRLASPEGRIALGGGDPRREGPGCPGQAPLTWVSFYWGLG